MNGIKKICEILSKLAFLISPSIYLPLREYSCNASLWNKQGENIQQVNSLWKISDYRPCDLRRLTLYLQPLRKFIILQAPLFFKITLNYITTFIY